MAIAATYGIIKNLEIQTAAVSYAFFVYNVLTRREDRAFVGSHEVVDFLDDFVAVGGENETVAAKIYAGVGN